MKDLMLTEEEDELLSKIPDIVEYIEDKKIEISYLQDDVNSGNDYFGAELLLEMAKEELKFAEDLLEKIKKATKKFD